MGRSFNISIAAASLDRSTKFGARHTSNRRRPVDERQTLVFHSEVYLAHLSPSLLTLGRMKFWRVLLNVYHMHILPRINQALCRCAALEKLPAAREMTGVSIDGYAGWIGPRS